MHLYVGLALATIITASLVFAFSPDIGRSTGAPGEATCGASLCHNTYNDNLPGGSLVITCSDSAWSPGELLTFHVALNRPGQSAWGFQAEYTLANNMSDHGALVNSTPYTKIISDLGPYFKQLSVESNGAGLFYGVSDTAPGWDFQWRAPNVTPGGRLDVYAGGLAANGDHMPAFDYVYTAHIAVPFEPSPNCCVGTVGNVDCDPNDEVDIADLTLMVDHLFVNFTPLCCTKEGYLDDNAFVDIADLTLMVDHLFISFQPLQNCIY